MSTKKWYQNGSFYQNGRVGGTFDIFTLDGKKADTEAKSKAIDIDTKKIADSIAQGVVKTLFAMQQAGVQLRAGDKKFRLVSGKKVINND